MTDKRQVIGIMTDTQRWDMVGCHGKERLRSRNMGTIQEDPPEALTFDHRCSDRTMDFIEVNADRDFFLTVSSGVWTIQSLVMSGGCGNLS